MNEPTIAYGYYWAKSARDEMSEWIPVLVTVCHNMPCVYVCGASDDRPLDWFTFGPRIEEPAEMHGDTIIGNFADWRCPSCRAESWDTAYVIANETRLNCTCGVQVKVTYPLNTPSAAAPAGRQ